MDREEKKTRVKAPIGKKDSGQSHPVLCTEPWESYYILRRGILPCCHGSQPIAPMSEWATAWNSPKLQEIRRHLSRGKLSPYCLDSLSCPIVQRYLVKQRKESPFSSLSPQQRSPLLRFLNRLMFKIPSRIYRSYKQGKE